MKTSGSCVLLLAGLMLVGGCDVHVGKPQSNSEVVAPDQVMDFATLYGENCAGCHGVDGKGGAAIALSDPAYLAISDRAAVRKVIVNGVPGTPMPAFAQSAGGMITEKQIDVIVDGMRSRWNKPGMPDGVVRPSYEAKSAGDASQGAVNYKAYCESCHGPEGRGGPKGSSITDPAYLSLVSDQGLRTVVITGRPELGAPDWRGNVPGKPLSDREITDVVSWLASRRAKNSLETDSARNNVQH